MKNSPKKQSAKADKLDAEGISALAKKALAVLATQSHEGGRNARRTLIDEFCETLIDPEGDRRAAFLGKLVALGASTTEIYEEYVPRAARRLGELWVEDKLSFVEVTIGASRLQEIARTLGGRYESGGAPIPLGHSFLMIVPSYEQHTMGAFIAASQFRRFGLWVHVAIDITPDEAVRVAAQQDFAAIGISISGLRAVEPTGKLIESLRDDAGFGAPVVVGGAATALEDMDLQEATGADLTTGNPRKVLEICGFNAQQTTRLPASLLLE